jgi:hypothetical protein
MEPNPTSLESLLRTLNESPDFESWLQTTPEAVETLDRLILSKYQNQPPPLWAPQPGPQEIARDSKADVTGYGGAAGGGKTDLALGLALTQHRRSLILRRILKDTNVMVDRLRAICGPIRGYNANQHSWRGLPGDRQIDFGGCENPGNEQRYRGNPHDLIVFDEADQFPKFMCDFITGWLRTTTPGQRCRELYCFNPPSSADGEWLLSFFGPWIDDQHPHPAKYEELRWYAMADGAEIECADAKPFWHKGQLLTPRSRTFIPAKLSDNAYLRSGVYGTKLASLPEPLRSQLLYGDFSIGRQDDAWQVIPTKWVKAAVKRWLETPPQEKCNALGVDVAAGGADQTVIIRRHGNWFSMPKKYKGPITDDGVKAAHLVMKEWRDAAPCYVDAIGYGQDCHTQLKYGEMGRLAVAVNVGEASEEFDRSGKFHFGNIRAAMWFRLREALDPEHGDDLMLPPDPELVADLTAPRYEPRASGLYVEEKVKIKERIGRSPDVGDAACLALWRPRKFKLDIG